MISTDFTQLRQSPFLRILHDRRIVNDCVFLYHHQWGKVARIKGGQLIGSYSSGSIGKTVYDEGIQIYKKFSQNNISWGGHQEAARTELCTYTSDLESWNQVDANIVIQNDQDTPVNSKHPFGIPLALIAAIADANPGRVEHVRGGVLTLGNPYSIQVVVRYQGFHQWVIVGDSGHSNWYRAWFDVKNGVIGTQQNCTAKITRLGGPKTTPYYLCEIFYTPMVNNQIYCYIGGGNSDGAEGLNAGQLVLAGGFNLTAGEYNTSYIPNNTGANLTRPADAFRFINSALFNRIKNEGSMLFVFDNPYTAVSVPTTSPWHLTLNNNDAIADRIEFFTRQSLSALQLFVASGGVAQAYITATILGNYAANTPIAVLATWKTNDVRLYANGVYEGQDTSVTPPVALDRMEIGSTISSTARDSGKKYVIALFDRVLSPAEAKKLTRDPTRLKWAN